MNVSSCILRPFWVVIAIFLVGCTPKQALPLRVATNVWTGYETLYLARGLGFYDHLPIRLVELTSATEVSHSLRNGTVEAAALTLDEALNLMRDGVKLQVILVMDVSNGADALLAKPEITQLSQLSGMRVGVESGATGAVILDAALQSAQLNSKDIKIVPLPANEHLPAWEKGRVDALVTFDPYRSHLISKGGNVLFDSSQIPGRIVDVLVMRTEVADNYREQLEYLLAGYFNALTYLSTHPQDAARLMAPRLGITPEQLPVQLQGMRLPDCSENMKYLSGDQPGIAVAGNALAKLMLSHQLLNTQVDVSHIAEPRYLPECR